MKIARALLGVVRRHWFLTLAVLVNLSIAAPAGALRWDDDVCIDDDDNYIQCCTLCVFFCDCEFDHDDDDDDD